MTTPLDLAVQRELADLRDEITRRPPALVTLDTLDRLSTAVEGLARAITETHQAPAPESIPGRAEYHCEECDFHIVDDSGDEGFSEEVYDHEEWHRARAKRAARESEPIAYTVVWEATNGEKVIDKPPTTLDIARAELADFRARWPEMKHYIVALVPVVTP